MFTDRMSGISDQMAAFGVATALNLLGAVAPPRLSILAFHRVRAVRDPMFPLEPDARQFDRIVKFVAHGFKTMTLRSAIACLAQGSLPKRAMVVTFDDGYADNADVALGILRTHGVPATFFVSTGSLNGGRMWNDSIIECVRACTLDTIDLAAFGIGQWSLAGDAERGRVVGKLLPLIKYSSLAERDRAIDQLKRICHVGELPTTLMMRSSQVREMHHAGMEIGAHTVHHPILTTLSASDAAAEIRQGKVELEEMIQAPVDTFAYPNGSPGKDYDGTHVSLLRAAGYSGAVSTAPGVAIAGDDLYQLPRFTPWSESMAEWAFRLLANQRQTNFSRVEAIS